MGSWVSELPDDVIHRIIANHLLGDPNLTNKTALRFGLLSKDLSRAAQRRPAMFFEWSNDRRCLQELKYMLSALKQNFHLQTFTIESAVPGTYSPPKFGDYSSFDRCIELAATNSRALTNLNLCMWLSYVLPPAVFQVKSLVQLDLQMCHLGSVNSIITWPNLKTLKLRLVDFGEGVFENMIKSCPTTEILNIHYWFFNILGFRIKLSNLRYLTQLDIKLLDKQLVDFGKNEYHKLRSMSLTGLNQICDDFFTNMDHQFPRLEELSILHTMPNIKRINISSLSLKKIELKYTPGLKAATFDVPNINILEFQSDHVPKLSFAGNSGGWISHITFEISNAKIDTSWFLKLKEFLPATTISITFMEGVTHFSIESHIQMPTDSVCLPGTIRILTMWGWKYGAEDHLAMEILDGIFLICRPQSIIINNWHDCEFPKLLYDNLMGSTRFNDPNFQHLMWNVTEIRMLGYWTELVEGLIKYQGSWYDVLGKHQVVDRNNFVKLFKVDHHGDWKALFNIDFNMEYYWRPENSMITDTPCRSAATSVKQATLEEVKDSMEPRVWQQRPYDHEQQMITTDDTHCRPATSVKQDTMKEVKDEPQVLLQQPHNNKEICPNQTNERHCGILNSVNDGRSRKFSGCCCFHFSNCKPLLSVKRLLFNKTI